MDPVDIRIFCKLLSSINKLSTRKTKSICAVIEVQINLKRTVILRFWGIGIVGLIFFFFFLIVLGEMLGVFVWFIGGFEDFDWLSFALLENCAYVSVCESVCVCVF